MITFIFSWAPDLSMLLAWFLDVTGSAIWLTNNLRKWTEMYGLKMCLRNVRHPSRTRSFWYYIRVLFIFLAGVCRCFVIHWHTKIQDGV